MNRTLETTIGDGCAIVSVEFSVETDEVPDFKDGVGWAKKITTATVESVNLNGTDIFDALTKDQLNVLQMECQASLSVEVEQ